MVNDFLRICVGAEDERQREGLSWDAVLGRYTNAHLGGVEGGMGRVEMPLVWKLELLELESI